MAGSGREGSFVYGRLGPILLAALCAQPLRAQTREVQPPALLEWTAAEYPFQGLFRGVEADVPCDLSSCMVNISDRGQSRQTQYL